MEKVVIATEQCLEGLVNKAVVQEFAKKKVMAQQ
jgi:hypothetical protein